MCQATIIEQARLLLNPEVQWLQMEHSPFDDFPNSIVLNPKIEEAAMQVAKAYLDLVKPIPPQPLLLKESEDIPK